MEEFTVECNGKTHRVEVEMGRKRRLMRIMRGNGQHPVLSGLSKFEDPAQAARYVVGNLERK